MAAKLCAADWKSRDACVTEYEEDGCSIWRGGGHAQPLFNRRRLDDPPRPSLQGRDNSGVVTELLPAGPPKQWCVTLGRSGGWNEVRLQGRRQNTASGCHRGALALLLAHQCQGQEDVAHLQVKDVAQLSKGLSVVVDVREVLLSGQ